MKRLLIRVITLTFVLSAVAGVHAAVHRRRDRPARRPIPSGGASPLPAAEVVFNLTPPAGTPDDAGLQLSCWMRSPACRMPRSSRR